MCTYCMIGDWHFRHDPPWPYRRPDYPTHPYIPAPINPLPQTPWPLDKLKELEGLLRRVKDLEDRLGCPCEPNKADYIGLLRERIDKLERLAGKPSDGNSEP